MDDRRSDRDYERDLAAALAHYAALTGNARASLEDPLVRRFCEAYYDAAEEALGQPGRFHHEQSQELD